MCAAVAEGQSVNLTASQTESIETFLETQRVFKI